MRSTNISDISERPYATETASSVHKKRAVPLSAISAAGQAASRHAHPDPNVNLRNEVDDMYARIMASVDGEDSYDPAAPVPPATFEPFEVSGSTSSRVAATQSLMRPLNMEAVTGKRSSFGTGRKGMNHPVRKTSGPGPGSYLNTTTSSVASGRGTPRWSIGGSRPGSSATPRGRAKDKETESTPGPGEYRAPSSFDGASAPSRKGTFARSASPRNTRVERATSPGPGSYAIERPSSRSRGVVMSSTPRMPSANSATPGPGEYTADSKDERPPTGRAAKGALITGRTNAPKTTATETPGPGTYATTKDPQFGTQMRGGIPQAGRGKDWCGRDHAAASASPGPGDYDPRVSKDGPAIKFHFRTEPAGDDRGDMPGPGQYDVVLNPDGPKHSMQWRRPEKPREAGPGPSDYDIKDVADRAAVAVIPKAPRDERPRDPSPGPGAYVLESEPRNGPVAVFGTAERPQMFVGDSETPGPMAYSAEPPKDPIKGGAPQTAPRFPKDERDEHPGPGAYALPEAPQGPAIPIGTSARETVESPREGPGPGAYEGGKSTIGDGPAAAMAFRRPEVTTADETPGVGAYDVSEPANVVGGAIGTGRRLEETPDNGVPGPGAYHFTATGTDADAAVPSAVIGGAPRDVAAGDTATGTLGPGAYEPYIGEEAAVQAITLGTSARFPEPKPDTRPGPGAYYPVDQVPEVPGGVFMTAQRPGNENPTTASPGPGAYVTDAPRSDAGVVFGTAARKDEDPRAKSIAPGPAAYYPEDVNAHSPHAVMIFRPTDKTPEANVGPGAYYPEDPNTAVRAVTFGTAPRTQAKPEDTNPGPGAYDPDDRLEHDASPQIALPLAQRFPDAGFSDTPGPGYYEPAKSNIPGAGAFGTAPRSDLAKTEEIPGPGAYALDERDVVPRITINAAPKGISEVRDNGIPGPGAYQLPNDEAKGVSMPLAARIPPQLAGADVPGPGAYALDSNEQGPAPTFGTAARPDPVNAAGIGVPGPGAYKPAEPAPKGVSFPVAPRPGDAALSDTPGPGTYRPGDLDGERAPEWTFPVAKPPGVPNKDVPGPGAYTFAPSSTGPAVSIGLAPRPSDNAETDAPGPGAYAPGVVGVGEGPSPSFGTAVKLPPESNRDVPGPGAYTVTAPREAPAISFGTAKGVAELHPTHETPAPNAYLIADDRGAGVSILQARRFTEQANDGGGAPGPGAYVPIDGPPSGPAMSFGTAVRPENKLGDGPGPGAYDINKDPVLDSVPAVSIAPLPVDRSLALNTLAPGPGAYDLTAHERGGPSVGFTTAERFPEQELTGGPGPGAYHLDKPDEIAPMISFGTAARQDPGDKEAKRVPGPGAYDPEMYRPGPMYSIAGKYDSDLHANDGPGPGTYDTSVKERGPAVSFAQATGNGVTEPPVPGPGAYALPGTLSDRAVSFGTAVRQEPSSTDGPGPAAYAADGDGMFDGPKYSFPQSERVGERRTDAPGPGAYNADRDGNTPAFSFGTAIRDGGSAGDNIVGPGAYDLPIPHAGPAVSFGNASPHVGGQAMMDEKPGPGQYHHPSNWGNRPLTMQGKWRPEDPNKGTPGPGQYQLQTYDPYSGDFATVVDFGKGGPRMSSIAIRSAGPGPGAYNTRNSPGRGVTILERFPEPFNEGMPGPPDYHPGVPPPPFHEPLAK